MTREEVWVRAFCAYVSSFNARTESGIRSADECLSAFDERFASDSDGTATAAANEDLPVPQDCQARAGGIAQGGA